MKYPYIGEGKNSGSITLIYDKSKCITLESKTWASDDLELCEGINEGFFKNITCEYLANTYGEVKSKEHAEFIKLLAETNKIPCAVLSIDMNYTMFYVIDGCLFFCLKEIDVVGDYKKITIPLPPELNTNTPEEDFEMVQIEKNNGDNLIFGEADKCEEWPQVGDEVVWCGKSCKVIGVYNHEVWIKPDGEISQVLMRKAIQKPKKPEEELRDELESEIKSMITFTNYNPRKIAQWIISGEIEGLSYNITKKPQ